MTVRLPTGKKDKGKKVISPPIVVSSGDEALDWGSDDGHLYDTLDDDIAKSAGLKRQHPLMPNAFYNADNGMDIGGGTHYDHISLQVPFLSIGILGLLIVEQQGQFCNGLVDSSFICICNIEINTSLSTNCTSCKKCKSSDPIGVAKDLVRRQLLKKGEIEFIGDLGASATFTNNLNDFSEYKELDKSYEARTANKGIPLPIKGRGTVFLEHQVNVLGNVVHIRLSPVLYIPELSTRLLSLGEWLQQGCTLRGTKHKLAIMQGSQTSLSLYPWQPRSTIYMMTAKLVHKTTLLASISTIYAIDYDLMHRTMGHPSRDVLHQATHHTKNFPKEIQFPAGPSNQPICRGCAVGKMHLQLFIDSVSWASRSFELIYSDLKELPTILYHKYKYFVTFLDDYSSHCWVVFT